MTSQRLKIFEHLQKAENHPTAEMVYKQVLKDLPSITLATVYRNLNLLAEQGEILRFEIDEIYRYDGKTALHQHGLCRKCGRIVDIFHKEVSDYALKRITSARFEGFKADSVSIMFRGYCQRCMKDEQSGLMRQREEKEKIQHGGFTK